VRLQRVLEPSFVPASFRERVAVVTLPEALTVVATILGLALRLEHAVTFDGPTRGADYRVHLAGVRWMLENWRPFFFDESVPSQVRAYPPLWYAIGALILKLTESEKAIAALAVGGWLIRQYVLGKILKEAVPGARWSRFAALSIHAVLPLSILIDGKVNPEGLHAGLFTVALYLLWRMERQASDPDGIVWRTAALFGIFAGLALLTKPTAVVLVLAAIVMLSWRVLRSLKLASFAATWRRLLRPAFLAAAVWCAVVGFWCGTNLVKFGHPLPHVWGTEEHPILAQPVAYRRPLGWLLPFEWRQYLEFPIIRSGREPRPNFWATMVVGTWSDEYNRGFCRLKGGSTTDRVWGGLRGALPRDASWSVTHRCIDVFAKLTLVGLWISLVSVVAVLHTAYCHIRTAGGRGSLVLPTAIVLVIFFLMLFALTYPYDGGAVSNPRYLLPQVTPMAACLGLALADLEQHRSHRTKRALASLLLGLTLVAIGTVAALVFFERFGN
jgi:hypothetical protein